MSSAAKAHEPTMEEILASIRRIISDDDKAPAKAAAPEAAPVRAEPEAMTKPAAGSVGQDDIDALFAAADEEAAVGQDDIDALFADPPAAKPEPPAPPPAQSSADEDDLDVLELTEEMRAPAPGPVAPPAPRPAVAAAPASYSRVDEGLISATVGDQVSNAFGSLAHTVLAGNAKTLDDIVREMLRPMLRAWLDDNLPPMVERLVRAEIERVARGGR